MVKVSMKSFGKTDFLNPPPPSPPWTYVTSTMTRHIEQPTLIISTLILTPTPTGLFSVVCIKVLLEDT